MSTEVKHGPEPKFDLQTTSGNFWCRVEGHYTTTPDWGAGGVAAHSFASDRPRKQMAELLVLRTAFLEWFREEFERCGGTRRWAAAQVRLIADGWEAV